MKHTKYLYWITFVAVNGGLLFGLNMAGISGANDMIRGEFNLGDGGLGFVAALLTIGCLFGALFTGSFTEKYGRKKVMIVTAFLYIISAIGCAFSTNIVLLNIFRLISGLGVGATSVVVPMYISEISPAYKRGYLVSFNQFAITIGILLAYVFDYFLIGLGDNSWRYMLAVPAFFGIIYLILLLTSFPESPRWLFARGRKEEAKQILYKIGGDKFINEELPAIEESLARDQQKEKVSISELFRGKTGKVVLIGTLLAAFQQITGVNAVLIYAPDIFQAAGSLKESSMLQSMLVGFINFIMTIVALRLVDTKGRKKLLLWGAAGMTVSLGYLTYAFAQPAQNGTAVLIALLAYISFFAASFAPVMWVIISEIYPSRIKDLAMSFSTACCWLCTFLTVQFAPVINGTLGMQWFFAFFCFFSILAFIFVKLRIPETKGKSLEQITLYISMLILFCTACSTSGNKKDIFSEWSFQCRETGEYIYEDNGTIRFGKEPIDDAFLWLTEATETENVRIRNKKTGHYLQINENGEVIAATTDNINTNKLQWTYKGYPYRYKENCGWYSISSTANSEEKFLTETDGKLILGPADRNKDFRAHWTVTREKGSTLPFQLAPDSVIDASFLGMRTSKAVSPTEIFSDYHGQGGHWILKEDIRAFPQFKADNNNMLVALYNMALEEMQLNLRTDSTFATGALWPDTWTRDVVYSIYFAFSWIHPDISKNTLQKQTLSNPKEALQDTGTGGSWPISTDRVVWALAAWEYYLATGDKDWLAEAYEGLSYTAEKDMHVAFDPNIGLFKGETCSMDWRTHTYPNWFSNENIGESFSSGTNALHMFMYDFLIRSGKILGKDNNEIAVWEKYHTSIKDGINKQFWDEERGIYTVYLYPEFLGYRSSQRVGIMSNGLCALLGAATEQQVQSIVKNYPLYPYGGAVLYPTIPDDYSYHNKSIWAVWQTPYMYAAKRAGNIAAVEHIMKSAIRQGAMFLTHKENMTHDTGYDRNTALNSDRQLWSVASYISIIYRMIFGMEMTETGLQFAPMIPSGLVNGNVYLNNFNYRNATLDIAVKGTGNKVRSLKLNGEEQTLPYEFPADQSGRFNIEIEMMMDTHVPNEINLVEAGPGKCWSPLEPVLTGQENKLNWKQEPDLSYSVYGVNTTEAASSPFDLSTKKDGFYSVFATNNKGFQSDLSNPFLHTSYTAIYEAEDAMYKSKTGQSPAFSNGKYVTDFSSGQTADITFTIDIPETGNYGIFLTGSNGVAQHDVYCYIRSVFVDDKDTGTFILESSGNWDNPTTSDCIMLKNITAGKHTVKLIWNPENKGYDFNMSHGKKDRNDAWLDYLKVVKL